MKLTKGNLIFITIITACGVLFSIALWQLPAAKDTEYVLDTIGCTAAKRLGAVVAIEDGICSVGVTDDSGRYLRFANGGRLSKERILGWRVVK